MTAAAIQARIDAYRDLGDGTRARAKIGSYPDIGLAKARQKARGTRASLAAANALAACVAMRHTARP